MLTYDLPYSAKFSRRKIFLRGSTSNLENLERENVRIINYAHYDIYGIRENCFRNILKIANPRKFGAIRYQSSFDTVQAAVKKTYVSTFSCNKLYNAVL